MADGFDWGLLEPLSFGSDAAAQTGDDAYLAALIEVEIALALAWLDQSGAPAAIGDAISALRQTPIDRLELARGNRSGGNPVIALVAQLRASADRLQPGSGEWVHRGATSQDILDSAAMLVAARSIRSMLERLGGAADAVAALASDHAGTLMAARTLTQHAAPTTFGATAASWLDGIDAVRHELASLDFPVQLGGSVGTGSAFDALTGRGGVLAGLRGDIALRLGLTDPGRSWHTERSAVVRVAAGAALAVGSAGRIAADLTVLARTEIAEVSEGAAAGAGSSSAMPQKRNPTTAVLIVGAAKRAPGLLGTVASAQPAEDQRPAGAWHAEWQALRELLRISVEVCDALEPLMSGLQVDSGRMRANLELTGGLILSESILSQLIPQVGRTEASALVSQATARAHEGPESFPAAVATTLAAYPALVVDPSPGFVVDAARTAVDSALRRHAEFTIDSEETP